MSKPPTIAIIYTTFMRDELAAETLKSVIDNLPEDGVTVCCVTQGEVSGLSAFEVANVKLEHDAGLSAARNAGVQWAHEQGIPFCLITADSIKFTEVYDIISVAAVMERYHYDLVGFDLKDRTPWEGKLLHNPRWPYPFKIDKGFDKTHELSLYKPCEICRNFFMAKTTKLMQVPWDEELKLREHEDFFWRWKQAGLNVHWTNRVCAQYVASNPPEYQRLRNRMYNVFEKKVKEKYKLELP